MRTLIMLILSICTLNLFGQQINDGVERNGFVIGFGIGGGVISISDSNQEVPFDKAQGGISFPNLKVGWMVNDRTAVLATFQGLIYEHQGKDRSFDAIVPSVQYWIKDRLWVNGGIGLAMDYPAFYEGGDHRNEDWNFGCAVTGSAGYEIVQRKNYALDIQTKLQLGRVFLDNDEYRDGVVFSVGLGFNWY